MTAIVVSRRDGVLTAPDGTKYRVARGKTLAEAGHPAVLANPGDWVPMVVTLTVADRPTPSVPQGSPGAAEIDELTEQVAELEETLAGRDAELIRLAGGLAERGIDLPAEDDRTPGWLVDLVLGRLDQLIPAAAHSPAVAPIAPPRARKRATLPPMSRPGDDV